MGGDMRAGAEWVEEAGLRSVPGVALHVTRGTPCLAVLPSSKSRRPVVVDLQGCTGSRGAGEDQEGPVWHSGMR